MKGLIIIAKFQRTLNNNDFTLRIYIYVCTTRMNNNKKKLAVKNR